MSGDNEILLPNGEKMKRMYRNALIMDSGYKAKYDMLLENDTRAGVLLSYIISKMDADGVYVGSVRELSENIGYSVATINRAIKTLKTEYSNLVTIKKTYSETQPIVNMFIIDKGRCFKSGEKVYD